MTEFDARRALLIRGDIFAPFRVTSTVSLQQALAHGELRREAHVLVVERGTVPLVLLTRQLTYHHVAQGEAEGEPWLVSY